MSKRIEIYFAWYDIWVGVYVARDSKTLYICPLPMLVVKVRLGNE